MDDQLQKLKDTRAKRDALKTELSECQAALENNRKYQQDALLRGRDALGYETEISRLQIRIQGINTTIKSLNEALKEMDEKNAVYLRKEKIKQVEAAKEECVEALTAVYVALAEAANKINGLAEKHSTYRIGAKAVGERGNFSLKVGNLLATLRNDLSHIFAGFPAEIFKDGILPKPEELKKMITLWKK